MENQDNLEKKALTREQKQKLISDWSISGLSKKKFAEEQKLKYCTFTSWFASMAPKKKKDAPAFTEVKLPVQKSMFAEVQKGNLSIRFFQPFPVEYFQLLIK